LILDLFPRDECVVEVSCVHFETLEASKA
jgi:hypothetical protein